MIVLSAPRLKSSVPETKLTTSSSGWDKVSEWESGRRKVIKKIKVKIFLIITDHALTDRGGQLKM
jgi:hypothetical protein